MDALRPGDNPHDPFTDTQLERFRHVLDRLQDRRVRPRHRHAAGSAAAMTRPDARFDLVRLGAVLCGLRPGPTVPHLDGFRPALTWRATVAGVRRVGKGERVGYGLKYRVETETTLAVVPAGFADGLPRQLGNRGQVAVAGRRRRIAGAVAMNHIVVDCGDDPVAVGEEVLLLGTGPETEISAEEFAQWSGSSVYETVTRIGPSAPRRYHGAPRGAKKTAQDQ